MNQHIEIGPGSVKHLSQLLEARRVERVFLVTGRSSFDRSALRKELLEALSAFELQRFCDFETNPRVEDVERGVAAMKAFDADAILACGGGSVMDMAKLLKAFRDAAPGVAECMQSGAPLAPSPLPMIAVSTTAGSGSESTHFAVLWVGHTKYSAAHPELLPDVAIADSRFLRDCPASLRATCGLDALCQAIESYWSIHSTDESRRLAGEAISLLAEHLEASVTRPSDLHDEAMSRAANLAGQAIDRTKTTAPHAVSYPITAHFGVPHGLAVALTVPEFLVFNAEVSDEDCNDARGPAFVKERIREISDQLRSPSAREAAEWMRGVMRRIGAPTTLAAAGVVDPGARALIVENGFNPDRVKNNPRELTREELERLLGGIG